MTKTIIQDYSVYVPCTLGARRSQSKTRHPVFMRHNIFIYAYSPESEMMISAPGVPSGLEP